MHIRVERVVVALLLKAESFSTCLIYPDTSLKATLSMYSGTLFHREKITAEENAYTRLCGS